MITKLLIANRGEIARRIQRTCREMGISTVAVHSDADRGAVFVQEADEAIALGGNTPAESYLDLEKILSAALRTGAEAIHPGFGFLSENAGFARRVREAGLIFVGPTPEAIEAMGDKASSKWLLETHGVPLIPGYQGEDQSPACLEAEALRIGFPLLVKASAGGGGKGMRIVRRAEELPGALEAARSEALSAFGDGRLLLERYFDHARHIEVQVVGDHHGKILHFHERECSMQRRFQKVIEEAPSPTLTPQQRERVCASALRVAGAIAYTNAGTVEMLLDPEGNHYFLEMNTRLQVEHPVTETVTGFDLVRLQLEVAQGLPLLPEQAEIPLRGHAIEARLYAEDAREDFRPATGTVHVWETGGVPGLRLDSGVEAGSSVEAFYDPMIAKIIAGGPTRTEAMARLYRGLSELAALGIVHNRGFLMALLRHEDFAANRFDTRWIERNLDDLKQRLVPTQEQLEEYALAATMARWQARQHQRRLLRHLPSGWRNLFYQPQRETFRAGEETLEVRYRCTAANGFECTVNGRAYAVELSAPPTAHSVAMTVNGRRRRFSVAQVGQGLFHIQAPGETDQRLLAEERFPLPEETRAAGSHTAPMPGQVVRLLVEEGETVEEGRPLLVLNSMKMENVLYAATSGRVVSLFVAAGQFVEADTLMLVIAAEGEPTA
jgi:acetyl/propionyl-CoA carboxylase alpha subunit